MCTSERNMTEAATAPKTEIGRFPLESTLPTENPIIIRMLSGIKSFGNLRHITTQTQMKIKNKYKHTVPAENPIITRILSGKVLLISDISEIWKFTNINTSTNTKKNENTTQTQIQTHKTGGLPMLVW